MQRRPLGQKKERKLADAENVSVWTDLRGIAFGEQQVLVVQGAGITKWPFMRGQFLLRSGANSY